MCQKKNPLLTLIFGLRKVIIYYFLEDHTSKRYQQHGEARLNWSVRRTFPSVIDHSRLYWERICRRHCRETEQANQLNGIQQYCWIEFSSTAESFSSTAELNSAVLLNSVDCWISEGRLQNFRRVQYRILNSVSSFSNSVTSKTVIFPPFRRRLSQFLCSSIW